jgi:hypothetical protein
MHQLPDWDQARRSAEAARWLAARCADRAIGLERAADILLDTRADKAGV